MSYRSIRALYRLVGQLRKEAAQPDPNADAGVGTLGEVVLPKTNPAPTEEGIFRKKKLPPVTSEPPKGYKAPVNPATSVKLDKPLDWTGRRLIKDEPRNFLKPQSGIMAGVTDMAMGPFVSDDTYGGQRVRNAKAVLDKNPAAAGKILDTSSTGAFPTSALSGVWYPMLRAGLSGSNVAPKYGVTMKTPLPRFSFDNEWKVTEVPAENNPIMQMSKRVSRANADKPVTNGELQRMRANYATTFTNMMGYKPGTPQYAEAHKYFMARGAENYNKRLTGTLAGNVRSDVKKPAFMQADKDTDTISEALGNLVATNRQPNRTRPVTGYNNNNIGNA